MLHIRIQGYIFCKILWWWGGGLAAGGKNEKEGEREKGEKGLKNASKTQTQKFSQGGATAPPCNPPPLPARQGKNLGAVGGGGGNDRNV